MPHAAFGGGVAESTISPIVIVALLISIALLFTLPRKFAIGPVLLFIFLTPLGEGFYVAGVHLFAQRILMLAGCIRVMSGPSPKLPGGFCTMDKVLFAWAIAHASAFILLYQQSGAVISQCGFLWDTLGGYIMVRGLIRDMDDVFYVTKIMIALAVLIGAAMVYERRFSQNLFGLIVGGSSSVEVRDGVVRARGPFEHEILASCFGGTLLPLFLWLWTSGKARTLSVVGMVSAVVVTLTASSSTGVSACGVGFAALFFWPLRKQMRVIRWALVLGVCALSLVMKAPVWFILAKVDFTGSSTGWDRANLIDQCVNHFSSWWLVGTKDNASWGADTWDLCNQFVNEAELGGLLTLILFIAVIYLAFRFIGLARARTEENPATEKFLWTLGAVLTAHVTGFTGVAYFDQTEVWWFVTLAMVCAITLPVISGEVALANGARSEGPKELVLRRPQPNFGGPSEADLAWASQKLGAGRPTFVVPQAHRFGQPN